MICRVAALSTLAASLAWSQTTTGWRLVFDDEFDGAANTPPSSARWAYDLGNGPPPGWGNNELESYTSSTANSFQDGAGHLIIQALSANGSYTSARLKTLGKYTFTYGKVVARVKIPYAQGIWPAFWMLGDNPALPWPANGEIDILENFGVKNRDASVNHGTIHGPNYAGSGVGANYVLPGGQQFSDDFHIFAMEWAPARIELSVDGRSYLVATPASLPAGGKWVFDDNPMYLLLNLAVGGSPAPVGPPDSSTSFPQRMVVDYVRVYQKTPMTAGTPNILPNGVVDAASSSAVIAAGGLASVYGNDLADGTYSGAALFDSAKGAFSTATASGVSISVNGTNAPLVYVSPAQINFQIPWETSVGPAAGGVRVTRGGVVSETEPFTFAAVAPSAFGDYMTGFALVTNCSGGHFTPGATCVIWGNGFGVKNTPQQNGKPASAGTGALQSIEVPGSPASCELQIGGQAAPVTYCGAAPGLVIDQLNFTVPSGATSAGGSTMATLRIGGATQTLLLPRLL